MEKTIRTLTLLLIAMVSSLTASAVDIFMDQRPDKYLAAQTSIVNNPDSPCNQGDEPFTEFMKQWNADASFRLSRLKVTWASPFADDWSDDEIYDLLKSNLGMLGDYGALPMKPKRNTNRANASTFNTFYIVGADRVGYYASFDNGDFGHSATVGFIRKDGLWYCVYIQIAG